MAALALVLGACFLLGAGPAWADDDDDDDDGSGAQHGICTKTARAQFFGCRFEVKDDFFVGKAICINIGDREERDECMAEAKAARSEGIEECFDVREAREDLCEDLGENRYDPDFSPENFESDFANPSNPNPYFPLTIGNVWNYESEDEATRIEVLNKTKLIAGVTCIVVNDLVTIEGDPLEDTDDWFGLRLDGNIDYCGESVQDFAIFEGDDPVEPELVEIDGSFKAGRDGDKNGTLFPGDPEVGDVFRQEWSASNAEDAGEVISNSYVYGRNAAHDEGVPQALADLFCSDAEPCVIIGEFSPLDPGVLEHKFYGVGIGKFLEVKVGEGETNPLVGCNFDPRCDEL